MSEFLGYACCEWPHLENWITDVYVGTLHEINSEASTVALENVSSFGTEGRLSNPADEIPPSDSVYEYIVFRGSDVKDLRVEEPPAPAADPPQVPNDPAILGRKTMVLDRLLRNKLHRVRIVKRRTHNKLPLHIALSNTAHHRDRKVRLLLGSISSSLHHTILHLQRAGVAQVPQTAPSAPVQANDKQPEAKSADKPAEMAAAAVKAPTPPVASKPSPAAVQPTASQTATPNTSTAPAAKLAPKNNSRIQPAVPLKSPAPASAPLANVANTAGNADTTLKDATAAATAAVAAAMAKLPPAAGQSNGNAVDNLTRKVNEMRTNDTVRAPRHPTGAGGFNGRARGNRGGARGGAAPKVEVPATDFDFEESNAKFNKQDLVKEAIAGEPLGDLSSEAVSPEPEVPVGGYNKSTSFFDNISSESKDRAEAGSNKPGGREWRGEEQKKNVETFGQGSVDNGYRGGYRGRGRGRGYRGRGYSTGQPGRGRGSYRGTRGDAQTLVQ
ncbi:putative protein sum2 [Glarea lozoyensis 74030]|uniref:Protein sum2 n=1 Tax=Glarea lozoyensis (strain ATCC 74030 / MF5533) TaxID=1104152 RepID=H0ERU2_GLAL7|nr:putative protein sum2 [Glarea lozoyensis 74030]